MEVARRKIEMSPRDAPIQTRRDESRSAEIIVATMIIVKEMADEARAGLYRGFPATELPV